MSADDNNENEDGIEMFIPLPPQEVLAEMRRRHDQHMMEVDDYHHSVARLFDSMGREQLETFRQMLHGLTGISEGVGQANLALYEGLVSGVLHARYGVCLACHNNHDEVMAQQMDAENMHNKQESPPMDGGDPFKPAEPVTDLQVGQTGMLSDAQLAAMEEYGLDDVRSADDNRLIGFICLNCRQRYPSIEDRMLRPTGKEGCPGCIHKEKWGA